MSIYVFRSLRETKQSSLQQKKKVCSFDHLPKRKQTYKILWSNKFSRKTKKFVLPKIFRRCSQNMSMCLVGSQIPKRKKGLKLWDLVELKITSRSKVKHWLHLYTKHLRKLRILKKILSYGFTHGEATYHVLTRSWKTHNRYY